MRKVLSLLLFILVIVFPIPAPTTPKISDDDFQQGVTLRIPEIGVNSALGIASSNTDGQLDFSAIDRGPILIETRQLGEKGVALIMGHRQWGPTPKVFASVDRLHPGSRIIIQSWHLRLIYEVETSYTVVPAFVWDELQKLDDAFVQKGSSALVLFTCTPYGTDWLRLFVVASLKEAYALTPDCRSRYSCAQ